MKTAYLIFALLAVAFAAPNHRSSFLRTASNEDTSATTSSTTTEETAKSGDVVCNTDKGACYSSQLGNGICDTECNVSDCGFKDVEDCAAEYASTAFLIKH
mmetsp:Transcript_7238/g.13381  ORF Transcript_7238/g.13381 Transcript_7238/m.13381 type:complete len:101 (-) Transcript_7238:22-324(-)